MLPPASVRTSPHRVNKAPYFVEHVRQHLEDAYGPTALYRGGFTVHTTLDLRLQQAAQRAIQDGLLTVDKRTRRGAWQRPSRSVVLTSEAARNTRVDRGDHHDTRRRADGALMGTCWPAWCWRCRRTAPPWPSASRAASLGRRASTGISASIVDEPGQVWRRLSRNCCGVVTWFECGSRRPIPRGLSHTLMLEQDPGGTGGVAGDGNQQQPRVGHDRRLRL